MADLTGAAEMAQKAASAATYGGSGTAMASGAVAATQKYLGLTPDEWTLVFAATGALVALAGFVVSWVYRHLDYRLKKAKAEAEA